MNPKLRGAMIIFSAMFWLALMIVMFSGCSTVSSRQYDLETGQYKTVEIGKREQVKYTLEAIWYYLGDRK